MQVNVDGYGRWSAKNVLGFLATLVVIFFLGCLAYVGLSKTIGWGVPSFIADFKIFYGIFDSFTWVNILVVVPLLLSVAFTLINSLQQSLRVLGLLLLCVEIALFVVVVLCGFNIIPR